MNIPRSALAMLLLLPAAVGAQPDPQRSKGVLRGVVRDPNGAQVVGAQVIVQTREARAETDAVGRFTLRELPVGEVQLLVRRLGYKPDTVVATIDPASPRDLTIVLSPLPWTVSPVVVKGRQGLLGPMAGFYAREGQGHGTFFTAEDITKRNLTAMSQLMRSVPGAQITTRRGQPVLRFRGSRVAPQFFLDGVPMSGQEFNINSFDPRSFAGIEIYPGNATIPPQFSTSRINGENGGVIVLWTKEGDPRPRRSKRTDETAAAMVQRLIDQAEIFSADEVDAVAHADLSSVVLPIYPDSLFEQAIPGHVIAEFVVDANGRVRQETFGIVSSSHPGFSESVRRSVLNQRYFPARRRNAPVSQVVQQPFTFVPDSSVVGRRRNPK